MTLKQDARKYKKELCQLLDKAKDGKLRNNTRWIGDISDHIKLCNKILDGKITTGDQLDKALWDMDTSSRDDAPAYIWKHTNYID